MMYSCIEQPFSTFLPYGTFGRYFFYPCGTLALKYLQLLIFLASDNAPHPLKYISSNKINKNMLFFFPLCRIKNDFLTILSWAKKKTKACSYTLGLHERCLRRNFSVMICGRNPASPSWNSRVMENQG